MIILVVIWALSEYHNAGGWPTRGFSQSSGIHDVWNFWIIYPVGAWVLILAAHGWLVYGHKPMSESDIKREMERQAAAALTSAGGQHARWARRLRTPRHVGFRAAVFSVRAARRPLRYRDHGEWIEAAVRGGNLTVRGQIPVSAVRRGLRLHPTGTTPTYSGSICRATGPAPPRSYLAANLADRSPPCTSASSRCPSGNDPPSRTPGRGSPARSPPPWRPSLPVIGTGANLRPGDQVLPLPIPACAPIAEWRTLRPMRPQAAASARRLRLSSCRRCIPKWTGCQPTLSISPSARRS